MCPLLISLRPTYGTVFDIIAEENTNITAAQKELLLWHFRLGHALHRLVVDVL